MSDSTLCTYKIVKLHFYLSLQGLVCLFLWFLVTDVLSNTTEVINRLINNTTNNNDTAVTGLDVVLIVNIINYTLSVDPPSETQISDYLDTFNLLQFVDEDILRAADQKNDSLRR